ncbi:Hypothetical protein, putative [Bodo saltans]|uniref:Uncharacterized protein n=1 Tax=Bodo saltans TaxID=75058 RepID=A0A0S4JBG9_BODSA|nr:Hypothetical protein, putative [Bodo saltans]|eukprot:CUG87578.1 Hypothetical protein, putative [Bodo saltans]
MTAWNLGSSDQCGCRPRHHENAQGGHLHRPLAIGVRAKAYSRMCTFFANYDFEFEVRFIAGSMNPADVLSRALPPPPILGACRTTCAGCVTQHARGVSHNMRGATNECCHFFTLLFLCFWHFEHSESRTRKQEIEQRQQVQPIARRHQEIFRCRM